MTIVLYRYFQLTLQVFFSAYTDKKPPLIGGVSNQLTTTISSLD